MHRKHLADENLQYLTVDGERIGETERQVLYELQELFNRRNPDIVQVSRGVALLL
ncbi:hypothetical protein HRED_03859 [Candidatus Haloredivivus sp. G17]|nr:hypothetical protein HRED_03859 [Candidatus Haloredivivus sp. G17]